jgi:hypothetical protein
MSTPTLRWTLPFSDIGSHGALAQQRGRSHLDKSYGLADARTATSGATALTPGGPAQSRHRNDDQAIAPWSCLLPRFSSEPSVATDRTHAINGMHEPAPPAAGFSLRSNSAVRPRRAARAAR